MVATVALIETIGPPPGVGHISTYINILDDDSFSGGARGFIGSPLRLSQDGSPTPSMERWIRYRFTQPFTQVFDFRFWMPDLIVPTGWQVNYGTTDTYQQPTNADSAIATGPVPTTKPLEPNCGGVPPLEGDMERYSDWIVLQAVISEEAEVGPIRGFDPVTHVARPLQYRFDWTEL